MKLKLLIPLLVLVALALPATAMAMMYAPTFTGNKFGSKTVTGACGAQKVLTTAVLRCTGPGSATVRYAFGLKAGCGPSVTPSVVWVGDQPSYGTYVRKTGGVVLWVRTSGASRVTISTVTLRYLCS
jgi:Na+/melibiose symporter-like transporter